MHCILCLPILLGHAVGWLPGLSSCHYHRVIPDLTFAEDLCPVPVFCCHLEAHQGYFSTAEDCHLYCAATFRFSLYLLYPLPACSILPSCSVSSHAWVLPSLYRLMPAFLMLPVFCILHPSAFLGMGGVFCNQWNFCFCLPLALLLFSSIPLMYLLTGTYRFSSAFFSIPCLWEAGLPCISNTSECKLC
jgi:hypothetical protein